MMIGAWRQIEGLTEDIIGLKTKSDRNGRRILLHEILNKANANRIRMKHDTLI